MIRAKAIALGAAFGMVAPTAALRAQAVGMNDIRAWIAAHHPNLYEDTTANTLIFVVAANGDYVRSVAARLDPAEVATTDLRFARMEELLDAREGRRQVDTLTSYACSSRAAHDRAVATAAPPVCVFDGVRVDAFNPVQMLAVRQLEVVRGSGAARFAPGADVAVLATSVPRLAARLDSLGVTPLNYDWLQMNRVRAGVVGKRPLDILILFLKAPAK